MIPLNKCRFWTNSKLNSALAALAGLQASCSGTSSRTFCERHLAYWVVQTNPTSFSSTCVSGFAVQLLHCRTSHLPPFLCCFLQLHAEYKSSLLDRQYAVTDVYCLYIWSTCQKCYVPTQCTKLRTAFNRNGLLGVRNLFSFSITYHTLNHN